MTSGAAPATPNPAERQLQALMRAWQKAGAKPRRQFLDAIEASGDLAAARGGK